VYNITRRKAPGLFKTLVSLLWGTMDHLRADCAGHAAISRIPFTTARILAASLDSHRGNWPKGTHADLAGKGVSN
jgi:hypothetical protein